MRSSNRARTVLRETQPFVEPSNNALASVAQLVIMLVFLGGFVLSIPSFGIDNPDFWGWLLFLLGVSVVGLALWFQYRFGSSFLEMQLKLMEHEHRDVELAISLAETRRDVDARGSHNACTLSLLCLSLHLPPSALTER